MTDKELKRTEYELMECDALLKLKVEQLTKYKELIDKIRNKCVDGLNYEEIDHYLEEDLKYILDLIKEYEDEEKGLCMKTITFKELIELIEKNEQPKSIKYFEEVYEWKNYDYRDESGNQINRYYTLASLINATFQIPTEPLLTDEEKAYLKAVIEPFKDYVDYIRVLENFGEPCLEISVDYESDALLSSNLSYYDLKFSGLEKFKKYTLEELDLE